jgi:abequosyltransferase
MNNSPLFTVCIPAYNRANYLPALLDSIFQQDERDFEVVICEDGSPERAAISSIVSRYSLQHPGQVRYIENAQNLGYDGNIRELVAQSRGDYCLFMGNDDLLCAGAIKVISDIVHRHPDCGVVVRSYATFDDNPNIYKQVFRYYPREIVIPPGAQAVAAGYRRSVVIPGMVIHRDSAFEVATSQFDGTLLYQLYLVGRILEKRSVVFTPQIIALRRDGVEPDFGNSEAERGKFVPKYQTPESSLHFMAGMMLIAQHVQLTTGLPVFDPISRDISSYSYPILAIQARRSKCVFIRYSIALARMGFWQSPLFNVYFLSLLVLGPVRLDRVINWIKNHLGYTPRLGAARGHRL